jgi:hypothetical protein
MDDNEFDAYTQDAVQELRTKLDSFYAKYNLDSIARRWECDLQQDPATLKFFDKNDKPALICDVIEIGSFSPSTLSWVWAWNNNSLTPKLRAQALPLKELQQITGKDYFGIEHPISADMEFA